VAGKDADGHGYVLADHSGRYAPTEWARVAIGLYRQYKADRIVAEVNNGGDMVEATVRMAIQTSAMRKCTRAAER
jgi:phage terminase large subunit-like protein